MFHTPQNVPDFSHLHVRSQYSIHDGLLDPESYVERVAALGQKACALTDRMNIFSAVKFFSAASRVGIQAVLGAELCLHSHDGSELGTVVALCENEQGYHHLCQLLSLAYTHRQGSKHPFLPEHLVAQHASGLFLLSGGIDGDIARLLLLGQTREAARRIDFWREHFQDRYFIECTWTGRAQEASCFLPLLTLASEKKVPCVATNEACFLHPKDFSAHEARFCIQHGHHLSDPGRPKPYGQGQYLRSSQEMASIFSEYPELLKNTQKIIQRCSWKLPLGQTFLPEFKTEKQKNVDEVITELAQQGLIQRGEQLGKIFDESYPQRLDRELTIITAMGFSSYFLIVADFIQWAKSNNIPVGPGRGSGAGSLVAYCLGICDIDPIEYQLLFERFLNPERVSLPDFDVDFCVDRRDEVIQYVTQKYGHDRVAQIVTFGTMAARGVVRDVGRVLGMPYGLVDKLAKMIPFELGITLHKALEQEALLQARYQEEEEVRSLLDLAMELEGVVRSAGKHAGGVVIAPKPLSFFTALYSDSGEETGAVTQFDKDDLEAIGLIKFDFLGLRTLTIIQNTLKNIEKRTLQPPIDLLKIPMDDEKTFALLNRCDTAAVFQIESRGMKDLIRRMHLDSFEDLIALLSLFRPGPLQSGMVDDFIDRKNGRSDIQYPHPLLESILKPTYGVILYQEQVMQIAQVLADYSLGQADLLRRAMGKKKPEEMAKQRAIFLSGAESKGLEGALANEIFDLMEKFSGYGFNKSHSAAYALITYQTAYLKAHYPSDFMAAVLSSDMDKIEKVSAFVDECHSMGITVLPPDIQKSFEVFHVEQELFIRYGLAAIKGVGLSAAEKIAACRKSEGPFKDLFDFSKRLGSSFANRRLLEALVRSGAMDSAWGVHRGSLLATIQHALDYSRESKKHQGQLSLAFDFEGESEKHLYISAADCTPEEKLSGEFETLGLYVTGHPLDSCEQELLSLGCTRIRDINTQESQSLVLGGVVLSIRTLMNKNQERMAFITLADKTERIELALFSDLYREAQKNLNKNQIAIVEAQLIANRNDESFRIQCKQFHPLTLLRKNRGKTLCLHWASHSIPDQAAQKLKQILLPFCGGKTKVCVFWHHQNHSAAWSLSERWSVVLEPELIQSLTLVFGSHCFDIVYS